MTIPFNGTDSFTYKANDGSLDSNTATVTITVNPVNDAPVVTATPQTQSVQYSDPISAVVISDFDPDWRTFSFALRVSVNSGGSAAAHRARSQSVRNSALLPAVSGS